jgi:hypothetical protein
MNIAIFNGFHFHYEMYGYIIYYCKIKNYKLTIFHNEKKDYLENMLLYKNILNDYNIEIKQILEFDNNKYRYDILFLLTDDDFSYNTNNDFINNKTICIDHLPITRNPILKHHMHVRPYLFNNNENTFVLPIWPNVEKNENFQNKNNFYNILIISDSNINYKTNIINRLRTKVKDKKIIINAVSRNMSIDKFQGVNKDIKINIYKQINQKELNEILYKTNYILTDINESKDYTNLVMSLSIPWSFTFLIPLIISKKTNEFYKFKNVITFDENTDEPIFIEEIQFELIHEERKEMLKKNINLLDEIIEKILINV